VLLRACKRQETQFSGMISRYISVRMNRGQLSWQILVFHNPDTEFKTVVVFICPLSRTQIAYAWREIVQAGSLGRLFPASTENDDLYRSRVSADRSRSDQRRNPTEETEKAPLSCSTEYATRVRTSWNHRLWFHGTRGAIAHGQKVVRAMPPSRPHRYFVMSTDDFWKQ